MYPTSSFMYDKSICQTIAIVCAESIRKTHFAHCVLLLYVMAFWGIGDYNAYALTPIHEDVGSTPSLIFEVEPVIDNVVNMVPEYMFKGTPEYAKTILALLSGEKQMANGAINQNTDSSVMKTSIQMEYEYAFRTFMLALETAYMHGFQNRLEMKPLLEILQECLKMERKTIEQCFFYKKRLSTSNQFTDLDIMLDIERGRVLNLAFAFGVKEVVDYYNKTLPGFEKEWGEDGYLPTGSREVALFRKMWFDGYLESKRDKTSVKKRLLDVFSKQEWRSSFQAFGFLYYLTKIEVRTKEEIGWFNEWNNDKVYVETLLRLLAQNINECPEKNIPHDYNGRNVEVTPFYWICRRLVNLLTEEKDALTFFLKLNENLEEPDNPLTVEASVKIDRELLLRANLWMTKDEKQERVYSELQNKYLQEFGIQLRLHK